MTEFKSIDEIKARIDRYWNEWELQESKRRDINLGKSFEILKAPDNGMDLSDEAREIEEQEFEDAMNQYYEQQNLGE